MTYEDLNIAHKYVYNRIGSIEFADTMRFAFGDHLTDGYIEEKWQSFQLSPVQFLASFDKKFFDAIMQEIKNLNYKG